ncbi:peptide chain release factor 1 [Patescibacteria group bacterium]|nr:peptide chain release factor 1 [Patescibacteria group bacterium]
MDIALLKKKYSINDAQTHVNDLEQQITLAHTTGGANLSKLSGDLSYYAQIASNTSAIQKAIKDIEEAQYMLSNEADVDIKEMAKEEIAQKEQLITDLDQEIYQIKIERQFEDEDDDRSAILEIRAGAGGDEAALFAADLFKMYSIYATNKGWTVEIVESNVTQDGGYKEVIAHLAGKNVFKNLKYESGVHRVQRIPSTESAGRIHTSTASVAILPEAKEIDIHIDPSEIKMEVMRASGAGGQCVNKTDSAVRITHLATGIVVSCQETKHQAQNKEKAMALLRSRLYDLKKQEEMTKRKDMRSSQIGSNSRAEKIRTYNFPQNRVTDHRVKLSWFNMEGILAGDIQQIIDDVRKGIQTEILAQQEKSE